MLVDVGGTDDDVGVVVVLIVETSLVNVRGTFVDDEVFGEDLEDVEVAVVEIVGVVLLDVGDTIVDEEEDAEVVVVDTESEFPENNHAYVTERL